LAIAKSGIDLQLLSKDDLDKFMDSNALVFSDLAHHLNLTPL